jgi:hypothetical protein
MVRAKVDVGSIVVLENVSDLGSELPISSRSGGISTSPLSLFVTSIHPHPLSFLFHFSFNSNEVMFMLAFK